MTQPKKPPKTGPPYHSQDAPTYSQHTCQHCLRLYAGAA